jgi:hypothetical protein
MGITANYSKELLWAFRDEQRNVVTRRQLVECGMTRGVIQNLVRPGGRWRVILPGVYAASDGIVSAGQREMAAMLYAGRSAVMTGAFGVRHYGLVASGPDYIEVLVPVEGHRRQSIRFLRLVHTERMPEQVTRFGPIKVAGAARAVADAVRGYRELRQAQQVICDALQAGLCTLGDLGVELEEGPTRGSAMLRDGLRDAATGIWSAAEGELMELIRSSDLPEPEYNVSLFTPDGTLLGIVDAWWGRAGVAAEVESQEFHFKRSDWAATMERGNQITKHRVQLMHFPPTRVKSDGAGVLAELRYAIAVGMAAPPLAIRAVSHVVPKTARAGGGQLRD